MKKGYIYKFKMHEKELREFIRTYLNNPVSIPEDIYSYETISGIPSRFGMKGRAFSSEGEIRWQKQVDGYNVFHLTETHGESLVDKLICECEVIEETSDIFLFPLNDKSINPSFGSYGGSDNTKISFYIYSKEGIPLTIRIRGLKR